MNGLTPHFEEEMGFAFRLGFDFLFALQKHP